MPSPRHAGARFSAPDFEAIKVERERFKSAVLARRTVASYESDWRVFNAWCDAAHLQALPASAETVEMYATDLIRRGRKISTVERHAVAIRNYHRDAGCDNPCGEGFRLLLFGARRTLCQRPNQKRPIGIEELRRMVVAWGDGSPIHARNRAVLVLGFASALRRASLAKLQIEDVAFHEGGILLEIRGEKQDRLGKGRMLAVPAGDYAETDPVRVLRAWLKYRGNAPGPLFTRIMRGHPNGNGLLGNRIGQIVQEAAAAIGLDAKQYGAHSLRAGFVTEAFERGAQEVRIAQQTGHASLDTLRLYVRSRDPFRGNAGAMLGL